MKAFGVTHQGKVRKENQDSFRLNAPANREILTAVLCDGMGGARGGSIASSIAAMVGTSLLLITDPSPGLEAR